MVLIRQFGVFILGTLIGLVLVACTKPSGNSKSSKLTVSLPDFNQKNKVQGKVGATSTTPVTVIQRVMINVTGSGMQPRVQIWEPPRNAPIDQLIAGPGPIPVDVPVGDNRLVQVLVATSDRRLDVKSDGRDENMTLYYEHATVNAPGGEVGVTITLRKISDPMTGDGRITGRHFPAAGAPWTGSVDMIFHPPGAPLPMIVDSTEMFAGWFDFFALNSSTLLVSYKHRQLGDIFTKTYIGDPALVAGPSASRISATRSGGYFNLFSSDYMTVVDRALAGSRTVVAGYFGNVPSGATVKYFSGSTSYSGLYQTATTTDLTKASFNGANISGGTGVTSQSAVNCSGVGETLGDNCLPFSIRSLERDSPAFLVRGPFVAAYESNSAYMSGQYDPSTQNLTVKWTMAPGTATTASVPLIKIYRKLSSSSNGGGDGGNHQPCDMMLTSPEKAFEYVGNVSPSAGENTYVFSGMDSTSGNNAQVALCPVGSDGRAFSSYAMLSRGNGFGGGSGPFRDLKITMSPSNNVTYGSCNVMTFKHYEDNVESPVSPALNIGVRLWGPGTASQGYGQLYALSDTSCAAPLTKVNDAYSASIAAGSSNVQLRFKATEPAIYDMMAEAPNVFGRNFTIAAYDGATSATRLKVELKQGGGQTGAEPLATGYCYPVQFSLTDNTFSRLQNNGSRNVTVDDTNLTDGTFYTAENCPSGSEHTPPLVFASSDVYKVLYFKPSSSAGTFNVTASTVSGAPTIGATEIKSFQYSVAASTVSTVKVRRNFVNGIGNSKFYSASDSCFQVWAQPEASNGAKVKFTAPTQGRVESVDGTLLFSNDQSCSVTSTSKLVGFDPGSWDGESEHFFVKVANPSAASGEIRVVIGTSTYTTKFSKQPDTLLLGYPAGGELMPNFCHKLDLTVKTGATVFTIENGLALPIYINTDGGSQFFDDPVCSSPLQGNVKIFGGGSAQGAVYTRASAAFNLGAGVGGLPEHVGNGFAGTMASTVALAMVINDGTAVTTSTLACVPLKLKLLSAGSSYSKHHGFTVNAPSPSPSTILADANYYGSQTDCQTPANGSATTTFTFPAGSSLSDVKWVLTGSFTGASLSIGVTSSAFSTMPNIGAMTLTCTGGTCPATP